MLPVRQVWYSGSENITFLVCHVIKQDLIIERSGDCNERSPSR